MVFRDPYFLDFLGLTPGTFIEQDVEDAIVRELEAFVLELGTDFAFLARQKRIAVDSEDYDLDLLFYHRRLRRLVAVDLKLGRFQAADKGQMELYLRWLEKYETRPGEEPPLGLILCADKSASRSTSPSCRPARSWNGRCTSPSAAPASGCPWSLRTAARKLPRSAARRRRVESRKRHRK